ncbi:MAG: hypothetical protein ACFFC7_05280 [Candidatus Hermodarchaeota archaeon]
MYNSPALCRKEEKESLFDVLHLPTWERIPIRECRQVSDFSATTSRGFLTSKEVLSLYLKERQNPYYHLVDASIHTEIP